MFKANKDKLSYYDFFQFIEKELQIKLQDWEEDALETRLDRLCMAFIEFNEMNEFCLAYDLDFGEALLSNDLEEQLDRKHNIGFLDYKLTEDDFFKGRKTILTSEKAALAQCHKIAEHMKKRGTAVYVDADFGPDATVYRTTKQEDAIGAYESMYKGGKPPSKGYPEPEQCKWMHFSQFLPSGIAPQFVDDGAAANECVQG